MFTRSGHVLGIAVSLALAVAGAVGCGGPASASDPRGIPDARTAQQELATLTVAPDGSMDGYDRDLFPHWSSLEDNCNVREAVLRRDGDDVRVGADCYPTSGTWTSPYDGDTWTEPSDVDIDHLVPLAAAWRSGAADWTTEEREAFANDLASPQLWAVTDNVNQSKGDQTPEDWKPPLESHWCEYARAYTHVKYVYDLTVNHAEQDALVDMLTAC